MKILYLMDPFYDLNLNKSNLSFVLANDLAPQILAKSVYHNITVLSLASILNDNNFSNCLNNVNTISINDEKFLSFLKNEISATSYQVCKNNINRNVKEIIKKYIHQLVKDLSFDIVIYWEYCSDVFFQIFNKSTFVECTHSGIYRIEKKADVLYFIKNKTYYDYTHINEILNFETNIKDKSHIDNFCKNFKEQIAFETNITRDFLDPNKEFDKILFFPLHFESNRLWSAVDIGSQEEFIQHLLEILPSNYALALSKHPLNKSQNLSSKSHN